LADGNWLVVGSLVRAELVRKVGGWRDILFMKTMTCGSAVGWQALLLKQFLAPSIRRM